jgi:hypothetical protein
MLFVFVYTSCSDVLHKITVFFEQPLIILSNKIKPFPSFFFLFKHKFNMNSKADLKAAREAIGGKKFGEAVKACKRVLLWEGENYNA